MSLIAYIKNYPRRQHVRPWALAIPILVLVVALPMLRPLRLPETGETSSNELTRLAAVQAMAEQHGQAIDNTIFLPMLRDRNPASPPDTVRIGSHVYSDKPPVLAMLLSLAYRVMRHCGLSFSDNPLLVEYLLTVVGATIPVAAAAGLIYRMGRLFDLRRKLRTALAAIVVFGSGLISYAVVINPHAPAAALVLAACTCLVHITLARSNRQPGVWLAVAGMCASLAAVIDLSALVFLVGLALVIVVMRWKRSWRIGGVALYTLGALPPLALHAMLTLPVTGDLRPPYLHAELRQHTSVALASDATSNAAARLRSSDADAPDGETSTDASPGWIRAAADGVAKLLGALLGSRGMLSHFPVLLIGMIGITLVLRRHWPISTKTLATVTLLGGTAIVLVYVFGHADWSQRMFGPRWFIVFLPLLLFWAGAWMRKSHHPATWTIAALLLAYSIAIGLLGASAPFVKSSPGRYTAAAAWRQLIGPRAGPGQALADGD